MRYARRWALRSSTLLTWSIVILAGTSPLPSAEGEPLLRRFTIPSISFSVDAPPITVGPGGTYDAPVFHYALVEGQFEAAWVSVDLLPPLTVAVLKNEYRNGIVANGGRVLSMEEATHGRIPVLRCEWVERSKQGEVRCVSCLVPGVRNPFRIVCACPERDFRSYHDSFLKCLASLEVGDTFKSRNPNSPVYRDDWYGWSFVCPEFGISGSSGRSLNIAFTAPSLFPGAWVKTAIGLLPQPLRTRNDAIQIAREHGFVPTRERGDESDWLCDSVNREDGVFHSERGIGGADASVHAIGITVDRCTFSRWAVTRCISSIRYGVKVPKAYSDLDRDGEEELLKSLGVLLSRATQWQCDFASRAERAGFHVPPPSDDPTLEDLRRAGLSFGISQLQGVKDIDTSRRLIALQIANLIDGMPVTDERRLSQWRELFISTGLYHPGLKEALAAQPARFGPHVFPSEWDAVMADRLRTYRRSGSTFPMYWGNPPAE